MGTRLEVKDSVNNLYEFWGEKLTKSLLKETDKNEPIINLASVEYSKSIHWKSIKRNTITPTFKEFKNGEYKVVMIFAKHARGAMARYLIEKNIQHIEDLKSYSVDGYSFNEQLSSKNEWVFVR